MLGFREPAFSFLSRTARLNGVPTRIFAGDMGLSFSKMIEGDEEQISKLAGLTGCDTDTLMAWTPRYLGGREHSFRGHVMHAKAIKESHLRGCPECLREDMAHLRGGPALRGDWLFRPVTLCHKHQRPLVFLWAGRDRTERYDVSARMAEISAQILAGEVDLPPREETNFDRWLATRLEGECSTLWIDQFSLYPAAHFCELLGRACWAPKIPKWQKFSPDEVWHSFDLGFEVAKGGERQIREVLSDLQGIVGEPTDGPKKKFGDLYDRLSFDLTSQDYAPFRALLRDHIAQTWPLGPGDELMGEPILERRRHSVLTAARELGMDSRRLRSLLVEARVVRPTDAGRSDAWELFDVADAAPILDKIPTLVPATEFQAALSISRSQFEILRSDGFFEPHLAGSGHKPLWDVRAARRFVEDILTGAEQIYVPMHNWGDLAKTAQRLRISPGQILRMIERRQLRRIGKHMTRDGYASILVTLDEVERQLERPNTPGITIEVFARQCGLKPASANRLVRLGHTPSTSGRNPKTKVEQAFLSSADIEAFHARFVTLRGLAVERGSTWQALRHELSAAGISPFSPDGSDYGAIYERSEVHRLD